MRNNPIHNFVPALLALAINTPCFGWQAWNVERTARLEEAAGVGDVAVEDRIAYMVGDGELIIYDVTNPDEPHEINRIESEAEHVKVIGNLLILCDIQSRPRTGFEIYDISDPETPELLSVTGVNSLASPVRKGNYLYLSCHLDRNSGIVIYDISDPSHPDSAGFFETGYHIRDLDLFNDLLWATSWNAFTVYDFENPLQPEVVSVCDTLTQANICEIKDDRAFIGGYLGYLWVIDISNPSDLRLLGFGQPMRAAPVNDIEVVNDLAFVALGQYGLRIWDLTDIEEITEVGWWTSPPEVYLIDQRYAESIAAIGGRILMILYHYAPEVYQHHEEGATVRCTPAAFDFSTISPGEIVEQTITFSNPGHIDQTITDIQFTHAWFDIDFDDVFTLRPREIREMTITFAPEVSGDFFDTLLVSVEGFEPPPPVIAHASATSMNQVFYERLFRGVTDARLQGDYCYLSGYNSESQGGYFLLDVVEPAEPRILDGLLTESGTAASSFSLHEDHLYGPISYWEDWNLYYNQIFAGRRNGGDLVQVEIEQPEIGFGETLERICCTSSRYIVSTSAGMIVTDVRTGESAWNHQFIMGWGDIEPFGELYCTDKYNDEDDTRLIVLCDLSQIDNPQIVGSIDIGSDQIWVEDIAVSGNIVYVAADDLYVIDASDPENPVLVSQLNTPGRARHLALRDNLLCLADETSLRIYDTNDPANLEQIAVNYVPSHRIAANDQFVFDFSLEGYLRAFDITGILDDLDVTREQTISLAEGWQIISLNIIPPHDLWIDNRGPDVIRLWSQLDQGDGHLVELLKDEQGCFWRPDHDFNNIGFWNLTQGYQICLNTDAEISWRGEPIDPQTDLPLDRGWNLIAYYPEYELPAESPDFTVLSPIIDIVLIAKDDDGNFMVPRRDFSNMPPWRMGKGYYVKVSANVVLNYPEQQNRIQAHQKADNGQQHWKPVQTVGNMSVLIQYQKNAPVCIEEIGAFTEDGLCVGAAAVEQSNSKGEIGMAIWEDDPTTMEIDGALPGEKLAFRYWNGNEEVNCDLFGIEGEPTYQTNSLFIGQLVCNSVIPSKFEIINIFPNPFNSSTTISYSLPKSGRYALDVVDIQGRLVTRLSDGWKEAGSYREVFSGGRNSSGLYYIRLKSEAEINSIPLMLIR